MASRQIQVRRRRPGVSFLPDNVVESAVTKIASVFKSGAPLKGLTGKAEREYLAVVAGIDPEDKQFIEKARVFWAEFSLKVDGSGLVLEIGTDKNGRALKPRDYLAYHFCMKHPRVAKSEEEMKADPSLQFYIWDPDAIQEKKHNAVALRTRAYNKFGELMGHGDGILTLRKVLRLSGINPDKMNDSGVEVAVSNMVDATPKKFLNLADDPLLSDAALIEDLVDKAVLRRVGSTILFGDKAIGESVEEAVHYIRSEKNSGDKVTMLAQLNAKRESLGLAVRAMGQNEEPGEAAKVTPPPPPPEEEELAVAPPPEEVYPVDEADEDVALPGEDLGIAEPDA